MNKRQDTILTLASSFPTHRYEYAKELISYAYDKSDTIGCKNVCLPMLTFLLTFADDDNLDHSYVDKLLDFITTNNILDTFTKTENRIDKWAIANPQEDYASYYLISMSIHFHHNIM